MKDVRIIRHYQPDERAMIAGLRALMEPSPAVVLPLPRREVAGRVEERAASSEEATMQSGALREGVRG